MERREAMIPRFTLETSGRSFSLFTPILGRWMAYSYYGKDTQLTPRGFSKHYITINTKILSRKDGTFVYSEAPLDKFGTCAQV